jgi:hypothetical protein
MDQALNVTFFIFHTTWIAFTWLGWMWRRTRRYQLTTASITALSWFGLGFWYGWGYCPCTEWHWQVRSRLGFIDPPSYIQLLIREVTGVGLGTRAADALALVSLAAATVLGVTLSVRDRRRPINEARTIGTGCRTQAHRCQRITPLRTAYRTISAALCRSSFSMMRARWVSTVPGLTCRRFAMSLLLCPSAMS